MMVVSHFRLLATAAANMAANYLQWRKKKLLLVKQRMKLVDTATNSTQKPFGFIARETFGKGLIII